MKKILFMAVAIIVFIGSVGLALADRVTLRASIVRTGVNANTGNADNLVTIIVATSLDNRWDGNKAFTARGTGSSRVYAAALSALSMDTPILLVVESDILEGGGVVPILTIYNQPPPTSAQSQSQTLENQQSSEPLDLLPETTDLEYD